MSNSNAPMFVQLIQNWALQIDNADGTTPEDLVTGGANGSKIESINVTSTDTADNKVQVLINDGTTSHLLATIAVPAASGTDGSTQPVNLLASNQWSGSLPYDPNGNRYLYLKANYSLQIAAVTAVTADKILDIVATGADF